VTHDDRRAAPGRAARPVPPALLAALTAQNARWAPSPARDAHLAALATGAPVVVTGQQVGLFLGPLFTLYKAASAVRVARALAAESGRPVVPVFWLQTEDHDLPEIASVRIGRPQGEPLALSLPADSADRRSVAYAVLPPGVSEQLEALRAELAHLPHGAAHAERLARHYRPGAGWAEAFAGVLAELFADEGLVLLDPRDPAIAALAAPVHARALREAAPLAAALAARAEELERAGRAVQVPVRAGAPLSFFHPHGAAGPRYRLEPEGDAFRTAGGGTRHSLAELLAALEADPLAFSSSALLRPIVQDTLLPTAAYVGGPAEVAYFEQLPPLYAAFGMAPPRVVPRARFRVVDEKTGALLDRLGLAPADAERPEAELLARLAGGADAARDAAEIGAALTGAFDAALGALAPRLLAAGPGLDAALEKTATSVRGSVEKLAAKYRAALLHRDAARVEELRRVQRMLHPGGAPQERVYGLATFAARWGDRAFVARLLDAIVPYDSTLKDLR
jgi:bacillithiol biosynthesis cysteine-adding enzyme BshC